MKIVVFSFLLILRHTLGLSRPFFSTSFDEPSSSNSTTNKVRIEVAAEFLLMATGKHGYFLESLLRPPSYDDYYTDVQVDRDQHLSAMAVVQMLQQLQTMERVDELLHITVSEVINASTDYSTVMNAFYEKFAQYIANDTLATTFAEIKEEMVAKFESLPDTRKRYSGYRAPQSVQSLRTLIWNLAYDNIDIKRLLLCTLFLDARYSTILHHSVSANGTLNLVKMPSIQQEVELIFNNTLNEVSREQVLNSAETITEAFISKLNSKLREDPMVNSSRI